MNNESYNIGDIILFKLSLANSSKSVACYGSIFDLAGNIYSVDIIWSEKEWMVGGKVPVHIFRIERIASENEIISASVLLK